MNSNLAIVLFAPAVVALNPTLLVALIWQV
jgi:hypothetical protein